MTIQPSQPQPLVDPRVAKMLNVNQLVIKSDVQRVVKPPRVQWLTLNWDWTRVEAPTVVDNGDGTYNVVEGQHRTLALRGLDPNAFIWCMVVPEMSIIEQAKAALDIAQERRSTSAVEQFWLNLRSEVPHYISAARVLEQHHVTITPSPAAPRATSAAATIVKIIQGKGTRTPDQGADLLDATLLTIFTAWKDDPVRQDSRLAADILDAIATILSDGYPSKDVSKVLARRDNQPGRLLTMGQDQKTPRRRIILTSLRAELDGKPKGQ